MDLGSHSPSLEKKLDVEKVTKRIVLKVEKVMDSIHYFAKVYIGTLIHRNTNQISYCGQCLLG